MYGVVLDTSRPPPGTLPDYVPPLLSCFSAHHHSEILLLLAHVVELCAPPMQQQGGANGGMGGGVRMGDDAPLQQCFRAIVDASQPLFTAAECMLMTQGVYVLVTQGVCG